MTRIAVLQMTAGIEPAGNTRVLTRAIVDAAGDGAEMLFTPEMSGLLDRDRARAGKHVLQDADNPVLNAVREAVGRSGIWVALGSLAVLGDNGKWANRSFVIDPDGEIVARYDKIHMFDVDLLTGETWRESNAFEPGREVVTVDGTPLGRLGLTVCYDIRFPALFEELGKRRCDAIAIPAAFTVPTGTAHWHLLQRARAVEATAWVIAAAQVGDHEDGRTTYGHSLVVDPWGAIALDMGGQGTGLGFADVDTSRIAEVRSQLPSLANKRPIPNKPAR